jgi:peptide/nickel transport system ATP-binding protein
MEAFPSIKGPRVPLTGIPGSPPNLANPPDGCRFAERCPKVMDRCLTTDVPLYSVDGELVRCLLHEAGKGEL